MMAETTGPLSEESIRAVWKAAIAEIREAWEKATPGPWRALERLDESWDENQFHIEAVDPDGTGRPVGIMYGDNAVWLTAPESQGGNATAIAAAPTHIAWLLDALTSALDANRELQDMRTAFSAGMRERAEQAEDAKREMHEAVVEAWFVMNAFGLDGKRVRLAWDHIERIAATPPDGISARKELGEANKKIEYLQARYDRKKELLDNVLMVICEQWFMAFAAQERELEQARAENARLMGIEKAARAALYFVPMGQPEYRQLERALADAATPEGCHHLPDELFPDCCRLCGDEMTATPEASNG